MKQFLLSALMLLYLATQCAKAQTFSHKELYDQDFAFTDGIYLNQEDFKNNRPIEKSQINSKLSTDDLTFFDNLIQQKTISMYNKVGSEVTIEPSKIFGYCSEGTVYINHNGTFARLGIIGNICHFLGTRTVYHSPMPTMGYYGYYRPIYQQVATQEPQQYFYNFETGAVLEYTADNLAAMLMADPKIHDEFMELKKKKRHAKLFYYMRLYNEKHPLYVPVYE